MNRPNEELTVFESGRHCTNYECRKCIARGKWMRRKAWHTSKPASRRRIGRK